jgi:hypothetical protein
MTENDERYLIVSLDDIFEFQDLGNQIWRDCLFKVKTFSQFCIEHNNDIDLMIKAGLNSNFFTLERWFDIKVINQQLNMDLCTFYKKIGISERQIVLCGLPRE